MIRNLLATTALATLVATGAYAQQANTAIVIGIGILRGLPFIDIFLVAISQMVSVVPAGLPVAVLAFTVHDGRITAIDALGPARVAGLGVPEPGATVPEPVAAAG